MNASRRQLLRDLGVSIGAAGLISTLPSTGLARTSTYLFFNSTEQAFVERYSDLLIPETETPGARQAGVPQYLDRLYAEWAAPASQRASRRLIADLNKALNDFIRLPQTQAAETLAAFDAEAYEPEASTLHRSYIGLKRQITNAYFLTEPGALQELDWRAVPGQWIPSMPLQADGGHS